MIASASMNQGGSDEVVFSLTDRVFCNKASVGESYRDDYLILDLGSGSYYGVGEAGGFIWDRLDGERELRVIGEAVAEHFEIDGERAATDLLEFVTHLHELGMVQRADTP